MWFWRHRASSHSDEKSSKIIIGSFSELRSCHCVLGLLQRFLCRLNFIVRGYQRPCPYLNAFWENRHVITLVDQLRNGGQQCLFDLKRINLHWVPIGNLPSLRWKHCVKVPIFDLKSESAYSETGRSASWCSLGRCWEPKHLIFVGFWLKIPPEQLRWPRVYWLTVGASGFKSGPQVPLISVLLKCLSHICMSWHRFTPTPREE